MKKLVAAETRHVDVEEAIVVVVACCYSGGEHAVARYTGLSCNIYELAVAEVPVEHIAR